MATRSSCAPRVALREERGQRAQGHVLGEGQGLEGVVGGHLVRSVCAEAPGRRGRHAVVIAAAGSTFGLLTSTVGTTVGLGTDRQVQLAARFSF